MLQCSRWSNSKRTNLRVLSVVIRGFLISKCVSFFVFYFVLQDASSMFIDELNGTLHGQQRTHTRRNIACATPYQERSNWRGWCIWSRTKFGAKSVRNQRLDAKSYFGIDVLTGRSRGLEEWPDGFEFMCVCNAKLKHRNVGGIICLSLRPTSRLRNVVSRIYLSDGTQQHPGNLRGGDWRDREEHPAFEQCDVNHGVKRWITQNPAWRRVTREKIK